MTTEQSKLADELDIALTKYLNAPKGLVDGMNMRVLAGAQLTDLLWDNKAGIIAALRAPSPDTRVPSKLAGGCCSAVSPCSHQKTSPYTLCEICQPRDAFKTVTIVVPSGYRDAAEFLKDCQFEQASPDTRVREALELARSELKLHDEEYRHRTRADVFAKIDTALTALTQPGAVETDAGAVQTLLDLLNPLHGELDRQTYDEKVHDDFDAPRDKEYNVNITGQMERDLTQAVLILEDRKRAAPKSPALDPMTVEAVAWILPKPELDSVNLTFMRPITTSPEVAKDWYARNLGVEPLYSTAEIRRALIGQPARNAEKVAWEGSARWQFAQRLQAYLDDAPLDGRHSDAAGGNAYDLIEEAIEWMKPDASPSNPQETKNV